MKEHNFRIISLRAFKPQFPSNTILKISRFNLRKREKLLLITTLIAFIQFLLHLGAMNAYGFHQDELLYMALGEHLSWGYRETPPLIALIGFFQKSVFGDSLIGMRILPALCAGAIVHLTGVIAIRLNGGYLAVLIAGLTVAFSSAFLATGALFIPQVFDELFWLMAAYLLICYVQGPKSYHLHAFGFVIGIGVLIKYTILLYVAGLLIGLFLTPKYRNMFSRKLLYISLGLAFLIVLPHLIWQYQNGFPALIHYSELQATQLVYLTRIDFLVQQLLVNGTGVIVWICGLVFLIGQPYLRDYRFLVSGFLMVMAVLIFLNGKPYYAFGSYPPIFVAGALFIESVLLKYSMKLRLAFVIILFVPNLFLSIIVLPYLPIDKASKVFEWTYIHMNLHFPLKWEDQKIHNVNQNYADMLGWDELASKISQQYLSLQPLERKATVVYADGYGAAGALVYYSKKFPMPPVVSLSSSFSNWAPNELNAKWIIYCSSASNDGILQRAHHGASYFDQVKNPYSRIYGARIYLIKNFSGKTPIWYANALKKKRSASFTFGRVYDDAL